MAKTTLGFLGRPLSSKAFLKGANITRIGGGNVFALNAGIVIPEAPRCLNCSALLTPIAQIQTLRETKRRFLLIWCCSKSQCHSESKGWRIIRIWEERVAEEQSYKEEIARPETSADVPNKICDFGSFLVQADLQLRNLKQEKAQLEAEELLKKERLNCGYSCWGNEQPEILLPSYEVEVDAPSQEEELLEEYLLKASAPPLRESDKEKVEEDYEEDNDPYVVKFSLKMRLDPDQILRYDLNGRPLWPYKSSDIKEPPPCPFCNSRRIFEVQLMPTFAYYFMEHMKIDWAAVGIFVCAADCEANFTKSNGLHWAEEFSIVLKSTS